ncbi:carbohydrate-binding domain-containing protein [uncultured Dubosiella sp.]|uniref:carbohydrate-binding domain-containing protein n=3 Tax=uncultured Dubosiella sp. TaxID=1937011 RepID=UPI002084B1E2|nr:carbohydrate-binding domain-containing protein [uncultured Dubosiella sp.]GJM58579.1 hypothetical protein EROP_22720 [Erysipelotrichaceae bacterium OPF54]GJM58652.1 hypothetical protein EROP_23450 [Erysipelotrichaceae bacterium OPF54]GJM58725.1 hypothetical protein EROP_24180 [Erysipelotrichaceae bacterium OPF54]
MLSILLVTGCSAKTQSSDNTQSKNESAAQEQTSNTTSPEDTNTRTLSGTYTDPLVIDTSGQVILTLSNADLESIDIRNADQATIILEGTNTISETSIGAVNEEDANAAIYADCPITFQGEGSLSVHAQSNHAIYSKDTIEIDSGTYEIQCANDGIKGKDGVTVNAGKIHIDSGDHGIASTKNKDKEYGSVRINGGTISIDAQGDGIHCTGNVQVNGEELTISSQQEGIEGQTLTLTGGLNTITAADDGLNASDPDSTTDEGMDPFASTSSNCAIVISGGQNTITAAGDGIDSNGSLTVSGGTTFVSGPENGGNFALDYDTDGVFEGGMLLACGMSGMVQTLTSSSPSIAIATDRSKDTNITLEQNGRSVLSFKASHAFDTLLVYDSGFQTGDEVCILDETITLSDGQNTIGNVQSMNSGLPGQPMGGGPQNGRRPGR